MVWMVNRDQKGDSQARQRRVKESEQQVRVEQDQWQWEQEGLQKQLLRGVTRRKRSATKVLSSQHLAWPVTEGPVFAI